MMCLWKSYRKKYEKNIFFASSKSMKKVVGSGVGAGVGAGTGSISQRSEDPNPDPHQNAQHWLLIWSVSTAYNNT